MENNKEKKNRKSPKNNSGGRYGFEDYPNAPINIVENSYQLGSSCPCCSGTLYPGEDRQGIQYDAQPPLQVQRYKKKVLRCNACGQEQVPGTSIPRHTNAASSSVIVQRALGMPLNRLSRLQDLFGVPVAPSTLWLMAKTVWDHVAKSIFEELCRQSVYGNIFGSDDTKARILEIQKRYAAGEAMKKGCYTSGIWTTIQNQDNPTQTNKIILYFTANKHCAENFCELFAYKKDGEIIGLMVDASSNSNPNLTWVLIGYCLAHGRRKFFELLEFYPEECSFFLEKIQQIYLHETTTKEMNAEDRMHYHRQNSLPTLKAMYREMLRLFKEKKIEPSSRLGKVFLYFLKRRYEFGAFARILGMPLDNNGTERMLRPVAIGRKNSLFFKTLNSAEIWSGLFSIVYTCEQNGINAYAYLNWLQENWFTANREPDKFLPWHLPVHTERIAA